MTQHSYWVLIILVTSSAELGYSYQGGCNANDLSLPQSVQLSTRVAIPDQEEKTLVDKFKKFSKDEEALKQMCTPDPCGGEHIPGKLDDWPPPCGRYNVDDQWVKINAVLKKLTSTRGQANTDARKECRDMKKSLENIKPQLFNCLLDPSSARTETVAYKQAAIALNAAAQEAKENGEAPDQKVRRDRIRARAQQRVDELNEKNIGQIYGLQAKHETNNALFTKAVEKLETTDCDTIPGVPGV